MRGENLAKLLEFLSNSCNGVATHNSSWFPLAQYIQINSNCLVGLGGLGVVGNAVAPTLPGVPGVGILGMVTGQTPLQGKLILP